MTIAFWPGILAMGGQFESCNVIYRCFWILTYDSGGQLFREQPFDFRKTNRIKEMKRKYRRHETHTTASLPGMQTWQADYTRSTRRMDPLTFAWYLFFYFFPPLSLLNFFEQRETIRENEIWRKNITCWRKENLMTRIFQDVLLPSNWLHTNFYNEKRFLDYISLELDSKLGHVVLNFS